VEKTHFPVRLASAINNKLLIKHVREVSQSQKQNDKNSKHKIPMDSYKMTIFHLGILYSLKMLQNSYCRDFSLRVATLTARRLTSVPHFAPVFPVLPVTIMERSLEDWANDTRDLHIASQRRK